LGLATSYSIIKNHDGYLSVESKLGLGTTFFIFLPASMQADMAATVEGDIFYGTGKILLMDDEEDVLKVTGEMLTILGYDVSLSRDGREAVEIYVNAQKKGQPYDLVIMDLTVPGGMGGKNTIKELLKKDPAAKSIVYSGYSNDSVMANFRDYGFSGVIKKPFTIEELSKLIHETISGPI
jgi:two-component system, cell cycle sensor histidine kinase and response regulator CckA